MRVPSFLLFFVFFGVKCEAYNILGFVGWPSFSHQRAFTNLWRELSLKGHTVTVITTNPLREKDLANLTEIGISEGYAFLEETYDWSRYMVNNGNPIKFAQTMVEIRTTLAEYYIRLPQIQNLINDKSQQFDVVLVEALFPHFLIFGEVYNAPTISISSFDPTATVHELTGNPWNPVVYPSLIFPFPKPYNFLQRVISTVFTNLIKFQLSDTTSSNQMLAKHFPNDTETVENMLHKVSFHFTAVNPLLLTPRPHSSRYVVIGGNTRMEETLPLSQDIANFLNSASEGFVYFSLGSNVRADLLEPGQVESIVNVFREIPYKILWKTMDTNLNVSSNVQLVKWVPQRCILKHPKIKVFVTQGGIQSIEEAVLSKVPMVGIPIFGDQEHNVHELTRHGIIKRVSHKEDNFKENLKASILEVFTNKKYKNNMAKFNELSEDQPISGTEKAIWHIEYTVRRKGDVSHLENREAKFIPWYQYCLLDVLAFLLGLVLTVLLGFYMLIRFARKIVLSILFKGTSHDKTD